MTAALCAVFFASGSSALIFETLWFQQAALAFGSSIWASSLVLAGFMAGLSLGNALAARYGERASNPLRTYAIAELAIAVTGVALVFLFPRLGALLAPALRPILDRPWALNPVRLALAFVLLLIPSTAMGITLPLLTKTLAARGDRFGSVLGMLYGWNTLGAVVGVVIGELLFIVRFGIHGTALIAGALNLVVAAVAGWLARSSQVTLVVGRDFNPGMPGGPKSRPAGEGVWLAAAFLSGFALLALEVVWFRLLLLIVSGDATAFALMLAVVLAGIALGGLIAGARLRRAFDAHQLCAVIAFAASVFCVISYAALPLVMQSVEGHLAGTPLEILRVALPLMFPVSFLSGAFFTAAGAALRASQPSDTQTTGRLTLWNTIGAALGSLIGGFVLLPVLGVERSVVVVAWLYGAIGLGVAWSAAERRALVHVAGAACVIGVLLFPFGIMRARLLPVPVTRYLALRSPDDIRAPALRLAAVREGLNETIQYLEMSEFGRPMFYQLLTNAITIADTEYFSRRYMKLYVYWPMAVHPHPTRALLIGYGVGSTAKAMTDSKDLRTIDVVDISRDVFDTSRVVYPDPAADPLHDPRVRVHVEDGRYFLQATDRQFDIVTAEPPPPTTAGAVNLYTREYFQLIRDRLAEGGITAYWLPLHVLSEAGARSVLRAFCDVFDDCSLWQGSGAQLMMIGTRHAAGPVTAEHFIRQWRDPAAAVEMNRLGFERPEQIGALFIGDRHYVIALAGSAPPLTDNYPRRINAPPASVAAARQLTASITDTAAARARFAGSPLITRLWPETMIAASLPYFDMQNVINAYTAGRYSTLAAAHAVLTQSPLRTPVLWLLGSDWDTQRVLNEASPAEIGQPRLQFQLGIRLLAERSFVAAAASFSRAEGLPELRGRAFAFRIYAMCLAGQLDDARRFVDARSNETRGETWEWLMKTFELRN